MMTHQLFSVSEYFAWKRIGISGHGLVEELTGLECQVLRLMSSGFGNKEIADRLAISEHTVKFLISSILSKLNVTSRTETVSQGITRGIISDLVRKQSTSAAINFF